MTKTYLASNDLIWYCCFFIGSRIQLRTSPPHVLHGVFHVKITMHGCFVCRPDFPLMKVWAVRWPDYLGRLHCVECGVLSNLKVETVNIMKKHPLFLKFTLTSYDHFQETDMYTVFLWWNIVFLWVERDGISVRRLSNRRVFHDVFLLMRVVKPSPKSHHWILLASISPRKVTGLPDHMFFKLPSASYYFGFERTYSHFGHYTVGHTGACLASCRVARTCWQTPSALSNSL